MSADAAPLPLLARRCFQDSSFWQDAWLDEPPERDQQLPGQGDNPELAQSSAAGAKPAFIPLRQDTGRWEAAPGPGDRDRHRSNRPIARFGDAQFAPSLTTLLRGRSQARQGTDLLGRLEIPPGKKFHHIEPGAIHSDTPQREELVHLLNRRIRTAPHEGPPLGLQRLDVRGEKAALLPRPLEPGPQGRGQWGAIPLLHLVELGLSIALQHHLYTMTCSEPLDTIDDPCAVRLRCRQCTVELPAVFRLDARHVHDTPPLPLPCEMA